MSNNVVKVLVADDSALMRGEITRLIEKDPDLQVVATARNGEEVLAKIEQYTPDVVTLDINMPKMDGLEALKVLMEKHPLPVIMLSSLTMGGAEETIRSLELGAFDFVHKPSGSISLDLEIQGAEIREKIKLASKSRPKITALLKKKQPFVPSVAKPKTNRPPKVLTVKAPPPGQLPPLVAIGVSTGGPKTLMSFLPLLPKDFFASVLIVQHMPEKFTLSFANRLNTLCQMGAKEAEDGEILESGMIYLAKGGKQMKLVNRNNRLYLLKVEDSLPGQLYKPSVNTLFNSLNDQVGNNWLGIILTGMGNDGADELFRLRQLGGHTIAESKESCVVFGMPAKAIEKGAAEFILNQDEIAEKIIELVENTYVNRQQ